MDGVPHAEPLPHSGGVVAARYSFLYLESSPYCCAISQDLGQMSIRTGQTFRNIWMVNKEGVLQPAA
jgi:hypothetical protein